jgi:hypothetical protein
LPTAFGRRRWIGLSMQRYPERRCGGTASGRCAPRQCLVFIPTPGGLAALIRRQSPGGMGSRKRTHEIAPVSVISPDRGCRKSARITAHSRSSKGLCGCLDRLTGLAFRWLRRRLPPGPGRLVPKKRPQRSTNREVYQS